MSKMMLRLLLLSGLAMGSLAVIGCADDSSDEDADTSEGEDTNRPGADAGEDDEDGNTSLDTGVVPDEDGGSEPGEDTGSGPDEDAGPDLTAACDQLGVSANVGETCDPADEAACGTTGACLELQGTDGPLCYTLCLPDLCGQTCDGAEQCVPLISVDPETEEQTPAEVDIDGDGNADTALGGCIEPPSGDVTLYGTCNAEALCESGLDCVGYSASAGVCASDCASNTDCPVMNGVNGSCVQVQFEGGETTQKCLLPCTAGSNDDCPSGFACTEVQGGALCIAE